MQDLPVEAVKVLIYSQVNILGGDFFSLKLHSIVHLSNFIKKDSITELFLHGSSALVLFKLSKNFLRDSFAKHFLTKSQASTG